MRELAIRYEPEPVDEVGKLWFHCKTESFSGTAFFWSNLAELRRVISRLECYPFGDQARWTWGYNSAEGSDLVLAVSIEQDGSAGRLKASVEMSDLHDPSCRLTTNFQTEYNALDTLRAGLELIVAHRSGEAFLRGH